MCNSSLQYFIQYVYPTMPKVGGQPKYCSLSYSRVCMVTLTDLFGLELVLFYQTSHRTSHLVGGRL